MEAGIELVPIDHAQGAREGGDGDGDVDETLAEDEHQYSAL